MRESTRFDKLNKLLLNFGAAQMVVHIPKKNQEVGFVILSQTAAESDAEHQCLDILDSPNHQVPPAANEVVYYKLNTAHIASYLCNVLQLSIICSQRGCF